MKFVFGLFVLVMLDLLSTCAGWAAPPQVGINLNGVTYFNKEFPFIDRMKTADDWSVSADGLSKYTVVQIDPPELPMTDRYVMTWEGTADFGFRGIADIVERSPGRMVFEVRQGSPFAPMDAVNLSAADPVRNIHIVREDQVALFQAGKVFNPTFLAKIAPFDTIRTLDWSRTNTADRVATWANRPKPEMESWSTNQGGGVPLEIQVQLANELGRNLWYNIPFTADDGYVSNAVKFIHERLNPNLTLYLEYSNEIWNWAFPVATMADQKGKPLGMDYATYGGFRAAQVATAARAVWGPDKRLKTVLAVQASYPGLSTWHIFPGVQRIGDPGKIFDAYAVTTYFYGPFDASSQEWWGKSLAWAKGGEAGLSGFFSYLASDSLPQMEKSLAEQSAIAKQYGLELVAYEGGQHLTANWSANAEDNKAVSSMLDKALVDPRMSEVYKKMIAAFERQGGTLLNAFDDAGTFWGSLPTIYSDTSPRYAALTSAAMANDVVVKPQTPDELVSAWLASNPGGGTSREVGAVGWPNGKPTATQVSALIGRLRKTQKIESVSVYRKTR